MAFAGPQNEGTIIGFTRKHLPKAEDDCLIKAHELISEGNYQQGLYASQTQASEPGQ